eukprot:CAMPEP_0206166446 /NCGR_PEP_ID=MMETSP1474-20131121/24078_1 /ASSEMBLY_ACC=CAM_ASM_001110 /TAXON_ID=97495 /ORGANISM="Imantonia sp., Strain RCC918" /LENGTH=265 /DNA_ID=CAMNT_0053570451 /DNA_START=17 /DNA_END=812 /DNA_ORIENTATION=-
MADMGNLVENLETISDKPAEAGDSVKKEIPVASFIQDVEEFMKKGESAEAALEKLQRLLNAFKFIEQRLTQKKAKLKFKMPEIQKTYDCLMQMEAASKLGEPLVTHYELAQSVYAKATIDVHESDKVCLWLGANVMLEYPRSEAIELLARQLADAKKGLATVIDDMGFLREQITITEVNMARVFNWDVKERRKQKEAAEKEGSDRMSYPPSRRATLAPGSQRGGAAALRRSNGVVPLCEIMVRRSGERRRACAARCGSGWLWCVA